MGFQLKAVFSSPADQKQKQGVLASAVARWPFIRLPGGQHCNLQCAHFAPPELTAYLRESPEAYKLAVEACAQLEDSLADWSSEFPSLVFAFIDVECFGGACLYGGFVCRRGKVTLRQEALPSAHRMLLEHVGITLKDDRFAPFERGYFAST